MYRMSDVPALRDDRGHHSFTLWLEIAKRDCCRFGSTTVRVEFAKILGNTRGVFARVGCSTEEKHSGAVVG